MPVIYIPLFPAQVKKNLPLCFRAPHARFAEKSSSSLSAIISIAENLPSYTMPYLRLNSG
jgi:hypothetical protein